MRCQNNLQFEPTKISVFFVFLQKRAVLGWLLFTHRLGHQRNEAVLQFKHLFLSLATIEEAPTLDAAPYAIY
jgi:hypothetical protein